MSKFTTKTIEYDAWHFPANLSMGQFLDFFQEKKGEDLRRLPLLLLPTHCIQGSQIQLLFLGAFRPESTYALLIFKKNGDIQRLRFALNDYNQFVIQNEHKTTNCKLTKKHILDGKLRWDNNWERAIFIAKSEKAKKGIIANLEVDLKRATKKQDAAPDRQINSLVAHIKAFEKKHRDVIHELHVIHYNRLEKTFPFTLYFIKASEDVKKKNFLKELVSPPVTCQSLQISETRFLHTLAKYNRQIVGISLLVGASIGVVLGAMLMFVHSYHPFILGILNYFGLISFSTGIGLALSSLFLGGIIGSVMGGLIGVTLVAGIHLWNYWHPARYHYYSANDKETDVFPQSPSQIVSEKEVESLSADSMQAETTSLASQASLSQISITRSDLGTSISSPEASVSTDKAVPPIPAVRASKPPLNEVQREDIAQTPQVTSSFSKLKKTPALLNNIFKKPSHKNGPLPTHPVIVRASF
jgi:hypothetical protein